MRYTRREILGMLAGGAAAGLGAPLGIPSALAQQAAGPAPVATPAPPRAPTFPPLASPPGIPAGPFAGAIDSLKAYAVPEWFRDAKFGIWAHWGPQSAAEYGDWYARRMYIPGEPQYDYHIKTYGHPSKVGFKDVIPTWKAAKFDPDYLVGLYKKAGARYFCSMGVHHDNFDLWNSKHQPKWNAVAAGPKKDIVSLWRDAARKQGLKFAVSEHLSNSFQWYAPAHTSDTAGPLAGVPYDGAGPEWADLYHDYSKLPADYAQAVYKGSSGRAKYQPWVLEYYQRIMDLIDQHEPDLLYTDGGIQYYGDYGLNLVAHHYNVSAKRNGGKVDAVFTSKTRGDSDQGLCILDRERGVADSISPRPWQTDTCIGVWHYHKKLYDEDGYKTPKFVVDMLVDIVSCNGNLMLNIPLPNNGMPDDKEMKIIDGITRWMAVNSEGIYGTRPYRIPGDGPVAPPPPPGTKFNESARKELTAQHVRYTTKGETLYAFVMGWPEQGEKKEAVIPALATGDGPDPGRVQNVELLGYGGKLNWKQEAKGLSIELPDEKPSEHAVTFKIAGAKTA